MLSISATKQDKEKVLAKSTFVGVRFTLCTVDHPLFYNLMLFQKDILCFVISNNMFAVPNRLKMDAMMSSRSDTKHALWYHNDAAFHNDLFCSYILFFVFFFPGKKQPPHTFWALMSLSKADCVISGSKEKHTAFCVHVEKNKSS